MAHSNGKQSRIRVAALTSTMPTGGAERVTENVLTRLDPSRFECQLWFLKEPGAVGTLMIQNGMPGYAHLQRHRYDPMVVGRLRSRIRDFAPDILLMLNCHRNAMLWGGLCAQFGGVGARVIAVHHAGTLDNEKNFSGVDMLFLPSTDSIVALSEWHARYLERVDGIERGRVTIIGNGIVADDFETVDKSAVERARAEIGLGPDDRVAIMVAGLRHGKEHDLLIRAVSRLVRNTPELKLLIAGDGPTRGGLENTVRELGVDKNVLFLGERRDVPVLLNLADVLVLASMAEAMPLSVIEAMAAGVPVIASSVGSVPDIIEDGVNGILVPPSDSRALESAIWKVLSDREAAARMAARARETFRARYTLDHMVNDYQRLFERLTKRE